MAEAPYSIIERNLRATMRFFGYASGAGEVTERDGLLLIDSGVNYSVFNIAMLTVEPSDAQSLAAQLRTAGRFFEERKTRWSIWLCEELLPEGVRKRAPTVMANERLRRLTEAPGMIADKLLAPSRTLPPIEWRRVTSAAERSDFAHITSVNFDIPFATCQLVYGNEQAWSRDYQGYVAYAHGSAVATTAAVVAAGAIGIYSVSTLPQFRRRGYAEALMRAVLAKVRDETGVQTTVLQATRAGYDMYVKMGYRPASRFTVYMV